VNALSWLTGMSLGFAIGGLLSRFFGPAPWEVIVLLAACCMLGATTMFLTRARTVGAP
jgi:F0F1-type ATP synthase assembly protein I